MESAYYSPDTLNQIPVSNLASFMLEEVEKNQFLRFQIFLSEHASTFHRTNLSVLC